MYRNSEGFYDPTAGAAISNVMKEYRKQRKETWRRETEIKERRKVYIASRYAGDVEKNTADAAAFCREAVRKGYIPIASHLLYPGILNDSDLKERELGLLFGQALLSVCDEVWFIGPRAENGKIEMSYGMRAEYREAMRLKKKIRFFEREAMLNGR